MDTMKAIHGSKAAVLGSILSIFFLVLGFSSALTEEIVFRSRAFKVVGELRKPEGRGPHPAILFVHGDGPNSRTAGGTYLPIMERMLRAGFATFAWDKPGTGESTGRIDRSRIVEQRSRIVLDAIAILKKRGDIDPRRIGLWGISQAGYVMPAVLSKGADVAFMIAVSCPGQAGVDQGIYLVTAQAVCAGLPKEDEAKVRALLSGVERARTYDEYVRNKKRLMDYPALASITELGLNMRIKPKEEWHADDLNGPYYWNPMEVIERTTIPVLAFFGDKDTQVDPHQGMQAYKAALERAGNKNFRVELIPDADHNLVLSETGCLEERRNRSRSQWLKYAPPYLDVLEEWLRNLYKSGG